MSTLDWIHPAALMLAAGVALPWLPAGARRVLAIAVPLLAMLLVWQMPSGTVWHAQFMDMKLTPLRMDAMARLFALALCLMAAAGAVYSLAQPSRLEPGAALVYGGAAVGVTLAGDLFTLFVCWELMAIGSTAVIWSAGTPESARAAQRYLMIHLLGGVVLFAGIAGHVAASGGLSIGPFGVSSVPLALILCGYLINAAAWPMAAWLPDAYPQASLSGTVFLSAFTTKTAVYVLMRGFPGTDLLVPLGLVMVLYGVVYALRENDIRRMLAYTLVNQNGLMLVGVGLGGPLAINGAAAQAVTGIVYIGLLMMVAGAVMAATGQRTFSGLADAGAGAGAGAGLARRMPFTAAAACVGAASVAALPLTSGFVAKSMLSQAAGAGPLSVMLMVASAAVTLHAGLRFTWMIFFHRGAGGVQASAVQANTHQARAEAPAHMRWAMALFALLCLLPGLWPSALYGLLPFPMEHAPYSLAAVGKQVLLLAVGAGVFMALRGWFTRAHRQAPDVDWLWRTAGSALVDQAAGALARARRSLGRLVQSGLEMIDSATQRHLGPDAPLSRTWAVRGMAMWVLVLMLGYLVLYYL